MDCRVPILKLLFFFLTSAPHLFTSPNPSVCLSVCLFLCLCLCAPLYRMFRMFVNLFACMNICLFAGFPFCLCFMDSVSLYHVNPNSIGERFLHHVTQNLNKKCPCSHKITLHYKANFPFNTALVMTNTYSFN